MQATPKRPEIDHHMIRLTVGLIAILLAVLTQAFAPQALQSISESYHMGGWSQSIFVGFLFAIAAFLLAYNGHSGREMVLSKIAAVAGLGVALFPCSCDDKYTEIVPYVHGASAAAMFSILAYFCYIFYRRASDKGHAQAKTRARFYAACGTVIVIGLALIAADNWFGAPGNTGLGSLTFLGEAAALFAFGIAWLIASKVLPVVTSVEERVALPSFRSESTH